MLEGNLYIAVHITRLLASLSVFLNVSLSSPPAPPLCQESLVSEVELDPMEGEQTWPTDEDLAEVPFVPPARLAVAKRVPKGTSDYQAAWIVEDSDSDEVCQMRMLAAYTLCIISQ